VSCLFTVDSRHELKLADKKIKGIQHLLALFNVRAKWPKMFIMLNTLTKTLTLTFKFSYVLYRT